jgi:hypothetical protein
VVLDLQEQEVFPELLALSAILKSLPRSVIVAQRSLDIGSLKVRMAPMKRVFLE